MHKYLQENKNMTIDQCNTCNHPCHCDSQCTSCECDTCVCDKDTRKTIKSETVKQDNWQYHF